MRSRFSWVRVGLLAMALGVAAPAQAYQWQVDTLDTTTTVGNLLVADLSHSPKALRLEWEYTAIGQATPYFRVQRSEGAGWTTLVTATPNRYYEDTGFDWGTAYEYRVQVYSDLGTDMGLPPPPGCAPPESIWTRVYISNGAWKSIAATPLKVTATDNQTADSRYDLRYGNPTFLDFAFGNRTYKGGLFAGWAQDPSRVARSYLRFPVAPLPQGSYLWVGSAWAYHTAALGSANIGAYLIGDNWSQSTLKWSTAPALGASQGVVTAGGTPGWKSWRVGNALVSEITGDGVLSLGLASTNENQSGWAYFAKKELDANLAPVLVYAHGSPFTVLQVDLVPPLLYTEAVGEGWVTLNDNAPAGGVVVPLESSDPDVASVPATVTVPQGQRSASFPITAGYWGGTVEIRAGLAGITRKATLTVEYGGWW
jgi:hypothetical protein